MASEGKIDDPNTQIDDLESQVDEENIFPILNDNLSQLQRADLRYSSHFQRFHSHAFRQAGIARINLNSRQEYL